MHQGQGNAGKGVGGMAGREVFGMDVLEKIAGKTGLAGIWRGRFFRGTPFF